MRVELIAECATNHGGSVDLATEFIWRFAEAGADWIKFQTTRVQHLRPDDPQYAWFQRAELSDEAHHQLKAECDKAGVKFLTTVYHPAEVPFVRSVCDVVKIGSGEAHEIRLGKAVREAAFRRVLVATGLTPAHRTPYHKTQSGVTFLACVTRYPCPSYYAVRAYGNDSPYLEADCWGWSDHCEGLDGARLAIGHGARIIEKHVCLPHQARPIRPWEATVEQFQELRAFADDDPTRFIGRWQHA